MPIDLSKLSEAVKGVAGLAADHAAMKSRHDAMLADITQAQKDVDALVAALKGAATSPAGAVGITAVAQALAPQLTAAAVAPVAVAPVAAPVVAPAVVAPAVAAPAAATVSPSPAPVEASPPAGMSAGAWNALQALAKQNAAAQALVK